MKDINKVILVGRLGADPIQRQTKTGNSVIQLSVATTRKFYRESSIPSTPPVLAEETQWHKISVWGRQGEKCGQYLKKGNAVYVEGFLRSRSYEKEGVSIHRFEIQAESVSFLGKPNSTLPERPLLAQSPPPTTISQEVTPAAVL